MKLLKYGAWMVLAMFGISTVGVASYVIPNGTVTYPKLSASSVFAPFSTTVLTTPGTSTYVVPGIGTRPPLYLIVKMVGAGGGGSGASASTPSTGTNANFPTTFGGILTAGGGTAALGSYVGGNGGTNSISAPALQIVSVVGGTGAGGSDSSGGFTPGPSGGNSYFGGAGGGGSDGNPGRAAAPNSGGGGGAGGAGVTGVVGAGGGAGGYVEAMIPNPSVGASYSYTIGSGGSGGSGSVSTGGAGANGQIIVEAHWQ